MPKIEETQSGFEHFSKLDPRLLLALGLLTVVIACGFGIALHQLFHAYQNFAASYTGTLPAYFEQATEVMKTGQASDLWLKMTEAVFGATRAAAQATQQADNVFATIQAVLTQTPTPASTPCPPTCLPGCIIP